MPCPRAADATAKENIDLKVGAGATAIERAARRLTLDPGSTPAWASPIDQ